jgi:hypothetical protein
LFCITHAGPLEATIHNLKREIAQVESELQQAKGSWHAQQKEVHTLISSNAEAAEKLALLQSTRIMLEHNCARLERQCVVVALPDPVFASRATWKSYAEAIALTNMQDVCGGSAALHACMVFYWSNLF